MAIQEEGCVRNTRVNLALKDSLHSGFAEQPCVGSSYSVGVVQLLIRVSQLSSEIQADIGDIKQDIREVKIGIDDALEGIKGVWLG